MSVCTNVIRERVCERERGSEPPRWESVDAVEITSLHLYETRNGNTAMTAHVLVACAQVRSCGFDRVYAPFL